MSDPRRLDPRIPVQVRVSIDNFDGIETPIATNLSKSGMYLRTDQPLREGTEVELSFSLPHEDSTLYVRGIVQWSGRKGLGPDGEMPTGMGIRFTKLDDSTALLIEQYVGHFLTKAFD